MPSLHGSPSLVGTLALGCISCLSYSPQVSADVFISGMLGNGAEIWRLDESGQKVISWRGPGGMGVIHESVGGLTMSPSGILYATENRMGDIAVRGWDPYSGRLVRQLTEPPWMGAWGNRFALPVALAAGQSGYVYAVGYEFNTDLFHWGENAGVLRLNEWGERPEWPLQPWIPYGAGGIGEVSDLGLDHAGDIYLSDTRLGILKYQGASGEFLGQVVPVAPDGLRLPVSLVFGPDGLLYVLDSGDSIHAYDPATGMRIRSPVVPESGQLTAGLSMDVAPDGILYVLSSSRIQKFDPVSGAVVDTFDLTSLVNTPGVYLSPSIAYFQIPEPSTGVLALTGLGLLAVLHRNRRRG